VLKGVTPPFAAIRSQTAPILSSTVAPAPTLRPASTGGADESDVVEGTDVTMDTSCSGDGQVSPEFPAGLLPRRTYSGFESSEDELAGGVVSEYSSISALATDNVSIARPWVLISDLNLRTIGGNCHSSHRRTF